MKHLKSKLKKSRFFLAVYEFVFQRPIVNFFKRSTVTKKALISYSTYHFNASNYTGHSNYQESLVVAEIFDFLGYQVDVVNNNKETNLDLSTYDVIFGEGLPVFQALSLNDRPYVIYYGTGSHPFHCTAQSHQRLISFFKSDRFLALSSTRTNDHRWGLAASMADAVICIGNETTLKSFELYGATNIKCIDPTFHKRTDALPLGINKDFDVCRKSMLWFGSYGLLHKGLDLAVDAVRNRPDWTLHVCGYTPAEKELLEVLQLPDNVIVHGFINVHSDEFKNLAERCGFVILPSCSEGIATAVVTAVGCGAMIPLVTKECGFDIELGGYSIELSSSSIEQRLDFLDLIESSSLKVEAIRAQQGVIERYTLDNYRAKMKKYLTDLLKTEAN